MPKAKPYCGPIDANLAAQLLNSSGVTLDDVPLGDALRDSAEQLENLVGRARKALEASEFAQIVAEHLTNKMNRRGTSVITVSDTGQVTLEINYEEIPVRRGKTQRTRRVPLMEELKAKAEGLGVDISEFGIKRKKIWEHLQSVEASKADSKPRGGSGRAGARRPRRSRRVRNPRRRMGGPCRPVRTRPRWGRPPTT